MTVLLLAPYAYYIPKAGLAGILMLSAWRLVDRHQLMYYLRTTRFDAWIVALTAISAVAVSVEFCVLIGVFLSFVLYVPQAARVHVTELIMTPRARGSRTHGSRMCLAAAFAFTAWRASSSSARPPSWSSIWIRSPKRPKADGRVVILRLKRARNPDAVCMSVLERFNERMHEANVTVLLCGVRPDLTKVINSSGLLSRLGPDRVFMFEETGKFWTSTLEAVRFAYEIDRQRRLRTCPRHAESLNKKDGWYYLI